MNFLSENGSFAARLRDLIRILGVLIRMQKAAVEYCHALSYRKRFIAGQGSRLLVTGKIFNQQNVRSAVTVGASSWVAGELLVFAQGGKISIGDFCYIGEQARVWSAAKINIGNRVFLSHGVNIHDNDAHSLSAAERHRHFKQIVTQGVADFDEDLSAAAIDIEDDVWIGFNSTILKGVRLGKGSIVGAASVVTRDVAPYAIVAVNPAVVIGEAKP
jgi:acetyltransferase-like isoleucine patch superfamily enzyme